MPAEFTVGAPNRLPQFTALLCRVEFTLVTRCSANM